MPASVFKCSICDCENESVSKFLSHCKFHRSQPNVVFECPVDGCSRNFTLFTSLKVHISRTHTVAHQSVTLMVELNQNVSPLCSRGECVNITFDSFSELKKHIKQHLSKKEEIVCPFNGCVSKFKVKSSFTAHMSRKHRITNDFPFTSSINDYNVVGLQTDTELLSEVPQVQSTTVDDNIDDFEYGATVENETHFLYQLALFYLKLQGKYLIPVSTIQSIISEFEECHETSQTILSKRLCSKLETLGVSSVIVSQVKDEIDSYDLFSNCNKGPLKTAAKRSAFYHKYFAYCDPVEVFIGLDSQQKRRTYQYVPVCQSISCLYKHYPSHFKFFNYARSTERSDYLHDVNDGSIFKGNSLFTGTKSVSIILYQDAFEVVNPLGSAKKKHKMVAVYYTLANFDVEKRSNIDHIQLILLCPERDLKQFSVGIVFERLVHDLKVLEEEGIEVNGQLIKGSVLCICGDNLGSHTIGGYLESFSGHFFCRYCEINRRDTPLNARARPRTIDSYNSCVNLVSESESVKGIKTNSPFNILQFYHVASPGLPPCLGHDLFEGVVSYDMVLIIKYLIGANWFTCEQLNHRIKIWPYAGVDKLDIPVPFVENSEKLGGHAVQNWVFLRLFSLMVENFVTDPLDRVWQMYLNLKAVVEVLTSASVSLEQIAFVNICIEEYLFDRQQLFPDKPLKPKHHFLLHYPELTLAFGPLIHLWTMRFESKHTYFKRCARQLHNYKHLAKTLACRHQMLQAYYTSGCLFKRSLIYQNTSPLLRSVYNEHIQQVLEMHNLGDHNTEVCVSAVFKNVEYRVGCCLVISGEEAIELIIGKIQLILVKDGELHFVVLESPYKFRHKLGVYCQVSCSVKYTCVAVLNLKCSLPVPVYEIKNSRFVTLKSLQN